MLTVYGLALCQAGTLQLTLPVYFLKRRPSTPSQLTGCRTGSAHSYISFRWKPRQWGNYNLDQFSRMSPNSQSGHWNWNNNKHWGKKITKYTCWWWTFCAHLLFEAKLSCRAQSGQLQSPVTLLWSFSNPYGNITMLTHLQHAAEKVTVCCGL